MQRFLSSVAVVAALSSPAYAQDASTVLANVDGVEITLGHLIALRQSLPAQYQSLPDDVLFNGMLDQLIQQELLAAAARETLNKAQAIGLENQARTFLAGDIIEQLSSSEVTDADLEAAYDTRYAAAEPEPEFNASHILVETEAKAAELITALEGGADFAALAQEHSTGPSGPNGGNLGWFGLGQMVPPFEQAVLALEQGAVSEPVQTQFGWHVVKLNEKRLKGAPTLAEVEEELKQAIRSGRVDQKLAELEATAEITRSTAEVDPSLIRNTDLLAE